jgi:hypothetical protein
VHKCENDSKMNVKEVGWRISTGFIWLKIQANCGCV